MSEYSSWHRQRRRKQIFCRTYAKSMIMIHSCIITSFRIDRHTGGFVFEENLLTNYCIYLFWFKMVIKQLNASISVHILDVFLQHFCATFVFPPPQFQWIVFSSYLLYESPESISILEATRKSCFICVSGQQTLSHSDKSNSSIHRKAVKERKNRRKIQYRKQNLANSVDCFYYSYSTALYFHCFSSINRLDWVNNTYTSNSPLFCQSISIVYVVLFRIFSLSLSLSLYFVACLFVCADSRF